MFLSLLQVNTGGDADRPRPAQKWLGDIYRVHQRLWMAFPDAQRLSEDPFFLAPWSQGADARPKPPRHAGGFLFRTELDGVSRILVQSVERPNWEYAFQNAPYLLVDDPARRYQVRSFDPQPRLDQRYRFRLLAHVVQSKTAPDPASRTRTTAAGVTVPRRKRIEIPVHPDPLPDGPPGDSDQRSAALLARWNPWRDWLNRLAGRSGFRVLDDDATRLHMEAIHTLVRNPVKNGTSSPQRNGKRYNAGLFEGTLVCTDPELLRHAVINGVGHGKAFGFGLLSLAMP